MKVFIDANILFSASNPQWLTRQLLAALEQAAVTCVSSPYVWEEAERNVRRHFPQHLPEVSRLKLTIATVEDAPVGDGQFEILPEKDRPVLAAAIQGNCTHLLTGDFKHFGGLMGTRIAGVKIVSQRMLADECFPD